MLSLALYAELKERRPPHLTQMPRTSRDVLLLPSSFLRGVSSPMLRRRARAEGMLLPFAHLRDMFREAAAVAGSADRRGRGAAFVWKRL